MQSSPELLGKILGVLDKINSKLDNVKSPESTIKKDDTTSKGVGGFGLNLNEFSKTKAANIKENAVALKELGSALTSLSVGVLKFGIMKKTGMVAATNLGITSIMTTMAAVGNPATLPFVLAGAAALSSVGIALKGIAAVLGSIAKLVLAFAGAIVILVGAIFLATKLFKVGPLAAMGIIVGSVAILAGGFALLGLMTPLIVGAGTAIAAMGVGLLAIAGGLLAYVGSLALINKITGSQEKTDAAIRASVKSVLIMGLLFAGLALIAMPILLGGMAVKFMGIGMIAAAGGILALGSVYALLTKVMKVDFDEMMPSLAKGIAVLGLTFAGLGLFSALIIPGTATLLAMGVSLGIFALISLGIGAIVKKLQGPDGKGLSNMSNNIALLVGGVLMGVIKGMSNALLGEEGSGKTFFGKVGTMAKNVAILIGSIGLILGVSYALIMFATALRAFQKPGVMKDKDGKDINVVTTSTNIANSIGVFFKTLTKTFKDPKIIPSALEMAALSQVLLGVKGPKILGIRLYSAEKPGIIDALSKFASIISIFAKVKQLPVYEVDEKTGKPKIKEYTNPESIANNIVATIKAFFGAFSGKETELQNLSTRTSTNIAEILLGKSAFKLWGLTFGRKEGKPGIIDALQKFSEVLMMYAKFGSENKIYTEFNEDGSPKPGSGILVTEIANRMVTGISSFLTAFNNAFIGTNARSIESQSSAISRNMSNFETVIGRLGKLGKNLDGIDKLSNSLGSLASNVGLLVENMGALKTENLDKLATATAKHAVATQNISPSPIIPGTASSVASSKISEPDWDKFAEIVGQKIADKISGLNTGEFQFRFMDTDVGNLSIKR